MTEKFLAERNQRMILAMDRAGMSRPASEEVMKDMEEWRQKGLDRSVEELTRHKTIWWSCGCIYGLRQRAFDNMAREGGMREDKEINSLRKRLSWIAMEYVMEIWMELGRHKAWHQDVVNVENLAYGSYCQGDETRARENPGGKWVDPRGTRHGALCDRMTEEKRWETIAFLMDQEGYSMVKDAWNKGGIDSWAHWSCCGQVRSEGNVRRNFCSMCNKYFWEGGVAHNETLEHKKNRGEQRLTYYDTEDLIDRHIKATGLKRPPPPAGDGQFSPFTTQPFKKGRLP